VACLHVRIQHELYQLYSYRGFDNLRGGGQNGIRGGDGDGRLNENMIQH
jgi:hypothetical protein